MMGDFKATKLWQSAIEVFKGVPLKRHYRLLYPYDACFQASEAVSWFHERLKEQFDVNITRENTVELISKFFINKIIVSCCSQTVFKDNRQLFRLAEATEEDENEEPPSLEPKYSIIIKPIPPELTNTLWERSFRQRCSTILGTELPIVTLNGQWIAENCSKSFTRPPSWVASAIDCLVDWPNASPASLYPGFELDVFKLIREYFISFAPLIPFDLHDLFVTSFVQAELKDANASRNAFVQEKFVQPQSESSEDFIFRILTPKRYRTKLITFDSPPSRPFADRTNNQYYSYDNPTLTLSPPDLINHPKYSRVARNLKRAQSCDDLNKDAFYGNTSIGNGPLTTEGVSQAVESFRLLTLLLPPEKRKHLRFLLRLMHKVSTNVKLQLDVSVSNKQMMISTFSGQILSETLLSHRIVTFLVQNDLEILNNHCEVDTTAKELINARTIKKIPTNLPSCSRITMEEYENQRLLGETSPALRALLDAICNSTKFSDKEKKQKIKQFRIQYPHIYTEKFGFNLK